MKLSFIQKGEHRGLQFNPRGNRFSEIGFFFFIFGLFIFFLILIVRLFQLTVVKGQYYRSLSEQNRIKEILIEATRGQIIDRKGFIIANNIDPVINSETDNLHDMERISSKRIYQSSEALSSIIGYRQTADENDIKNDHCQQKIKLGDKVGKKGIEKIFDCILRGQPGKKLVETDAQGKMLRTITVLPPKKGKTIQLSLDLDLQKKAYDLIKNIPEKAAIVAVVPSTGEILTSVSTPSYNPQDFEDKSIADIQRYLKDERQPLFNRVAEGGYPPGSIYKLVTAVAGLEERAIDEKTEIEDTGTVKAGPLTFGNWYFLQYGKTEGLVDIVKAIKRSNDIFFYKVGEKTGVDKIKKWSEIFGYGKKTGIGINEEEGLIPSEFWKKDVLGENWYLGDTYNLAIGQGYVSVTPLQTVMVTAAFANGGYLCKPELLKNQNPNDNLPADGQECKKLPISKKTVDFIREGMKQACSTGGTGWPLFEFTVHSSGLTDNKAKQTTTNNELLTKIQTACKTGTAESHAKSGRPHAWITVFAPFENPEIALTVLVEEGGQGSDVAGPIARDLLKAYFERSQ